MSDKVKPSRKVILEMFKDKHFYKFIHSFFKGHINPYEMTTWRINPSWGLDVYAFNMDEEGATKAKRLAHDSASFTVNLTEKDDDKFMIMMINKEYGGLLLWMLDLMDVKYEDAEKFDPYKYDVFNTYITKYGSN